MSKAFDGVNQYLKRDIAAVAGPPFTMACWFNSDDIATIQCLMSIADGASDNNYHQLILAGTVGGDPLYCQSRVPAGTASAFTSSGYSVNTWHHACAVFSAVDSRAVFIDGGSKGTDATSRTPAGLDRTGVGALVRSTLAYYMSGMIAESAIWDVALTDEEIGILAEGYSPFFVRLQSLKYYWMLKYVDVSSNPDIVGKMYLADYNSPTMAAPPPIYYPSQVLFGEVPLPPKQLQGELSIQPVFSAGLDMQSELTCEEDLVMSPTYT